MQYTVYVIRSLKTGKYYIGHAQDLESRLARHVAGKTRSLKNKGPFEVVYTELYPTRSQAYVREKQIKAYKGGV